MGRTLGNTRVSVWAAGFIARAYNRLVSRVRSVMPFLRGVESGGVAKNICLIMKDYMDAAGSGLVGLVPSAGK